MPTYYQFGPDPATNRGRLGFLNGIQFNPTAMDYYQNNKDAQFQLALQGYPDSGARMVSPSFRSYVEKAWLPNQYDRWQGQVGVGDQSADFFLTDWAAKRDPWEDYLRTNPYADRYGRTARPTRLLRR